MSRTRVLSALTAALFLTLTAPAVAAPVPLPAAHASHSDARKAKKAHLTYAITPYPRSSRTWDVAVTLTRKGKPLPNKRLTYKAHVGGKLPGEKTSTDATGVAHVYYGNNEPFTVRFIYKGNKKTRGARITFTIPAFPLPSS